MTIMTSAYARLDDADAVDRPSFTVRAATPSDQPGIAAILSSRHILDGTMRVPHEPIDGLPDRLEQTDGQRILVAMSGDGVAGFLLLKSWPGAPRHRHVAEIDLVATREDWQGRGVARKLMVEAIDMAEQWMGIRRLQLVVFTTNTHAIRLYEDLGFEIEGTMQAYGFGRGVDTDAHLMARVNPISG